MFIYIFITQPFEAFFYVLLIYHKNVAWTVETPVPRFNVVSSNCYIGSSGIWEKEIGSQILNDGMTISHEKYTEEWDGGTTGFRCQS